MQKICKKHGILKEKHIKIRLKRGYQCKECKLCIYEANKIRRIKYSNKYKVLQKKYNARYKEKFGDIDKIKRGKKRQLHINTLADKYIRERLYKQYKLKPEDITKDLILLKRAQILCKRYVKNMGN